MLRTIATYGIVAGLIVGVTLYTMTVSLQGRPPTGAIGMAIGYLTMLIALSTIFVAVKRRRDLELGGVIRFWPAFGLGLAISSVAGLIYVVAWEAAMASVDTDFMAYYTETMLAEQRAAGASAADLAKTKVDMDALRTSYADPLFRLPMTFAEIFPVGVLVSLVTAALLRNPRFLPARTPVSGAHA